MEIRKEHIKRVYYLEMMDMGCNFDKLEIYDEPITARQLHEIKQKMDAIGFGSQRGKVVDRLQNFYLHLRKCSKAKGWKAEWEEMQNKKGHKSIL